MDTILQKSTLLLTNGYLHLKYSEVDDLRNLLDEFGQVIQKTDIKERADSSRLLVSNQPMGFHTDHHAAKYIAWFCNSQSAVGGESILVDAIKIVNGFSESHISLLKEITVRTHQVFYDDKLTLPLLKFDANEQLKSIYYAPWLVNRPSDTKLQKALEKFESAIQSTEPKKLLLSEGDMLMIDNHRMLHGRAGFPPKSSRWLTRYWIKQQ